MQVDELRHSLMQQGLQRSALPADPYTLFEAWYQLVLDCGLPEPNAMCLATVDTTGQPWQRMVLFKLFDRDGFVFFTNYESRKAGHIAENNRVSLLFPWHALGRQVKITGQASRISTADSLKYFVTRPRGSQIGAWASPQSQVINSRSLLDGLVEQVKHKFREGEIPLPSFWGGYRVQPASVEFWQARENRLHDRFLYRRQQTAGWHIQRLAP